jgi:ferredoxin
MADVEYVAVLGSGPSAVAVLLELKSCSNLKIDVLDTGLNSYAEPPKNKDFRKLSNGSYHPYSEFPSGPLIQQSSVDLPFSFAKSGLSTVWGSTLSKFSTDFLDEIFGENAKSIQKSYDKIAKDIPISKVGTNLNDSGYGNQNPIIVSERIRLIINELNITNKDIAVQETYLALLNSNVNNCVYCGNCMAYCPKDLIWKASNTFDNFSQLDNLTYLSDRRCVEINEVKGKYLIRSLNSIGAEFVHGPYSKVYLCTGPIETFRILSESKMISGKKYLRQNSTFYLPIFSRRIQHQPDTAFGMTQLTVAVKKDAKRMLFLQIYEFSPNHIELLKKKYPMLKLVPSFLLKQTLKNFLLAIGYLDSSVSPKLEMELCDSKVNLGLIEDVEVYETKKMIRNVLIENSNFFRSARLRPLNWFISLTKPGNGVHVSGSLVVGKDLDAKGKVLGSHGVYVCDSSSLPDLEPGPVTYTIMANAMRIAEESTI